MFAKHSLSMMMITCFLLADWLAGWVACRLVGWFVVCLFVCLRRAALLSFLFSLLQMHQLGHAGTSPAYYPRVVQSLYHVQHMRMVSCGAEHTLALAADGRVFSWGCGRNGRIGNGVCKNQNLPVLLLSLIHI